MDLIEATDVGVVVGGGVVFVAVDFVAVFNVVVFALLVVTDHIIFRVNKC